MKPVFRVVLPTIVVLLAWTAAVVLGTLDGWWQKPIAPPGDSQAFMAAAVERLDGSYSGNVVLTLIEEGVVIGEHGASVGDPVDRDSVFQVASLSKWVTAVGVMTLVEEGRIDLDAPVGRYLTRWSLPESEFDHDGVTTRRLLSHTAGLTDGLGYAGFEPGTPVQGLEASLTRAADASPGASGEVRVGYEPGTGWLYSGGGYTLLQLLVEEVSGESFEAYMQRAVLQPLGMSHSSFHWQEEDGATLTTIYGPGSEPAIHYRFTALAAASLYTSASDLTRLIQAHLPGPAGEPVGRGVLEPASLLAMRQPHGVQMGQPIWGLGTILYAPNGEDGFVVGHDGNNEPAINTAARFNPATGNGIVVLETGDPLLATSLAAEWVFWESGNPGLLAILIGLPQTISTLLFGGAAILLVGLFAGWRVWRISARVPTHAPTGGVD